MDTKECEVCVAVNGENVFLLQTKLWSVVLAKDQAYLGRCFVTARRHVGSLSDLTTEEWQGYIAIAQQLETATTKAFGASLHNWNCLMNNAFQKEPSLPHVHWHFRPRYKDAVTFAGEAFEDPFFGYHYKSDYKKLVTNEVLEQIKAKLLENL